MKLRILAVALVVALPAFAQDSKTTPTLKSVLLAQLRSTHNQAEWFVLANTSVEGLTAEQANWTAGTENHSVVQLVTHNAYHIGQIIYVRKEQGSWDPEKGVKE